MPTEEILYKKIDDPVNFRRQLLEASKQMIHALQRYEKLKKTRTKKAEQINKLKSIVRELNDLVSKLKKDFPDVTFKSKKGESKKEGKKGQGKKGQGKKGGKSGKAKGEEEKEETGAEKKPRESKEMHDLENQLKDIEKKLENIS
ncbi:MAG: hypothetical protein R6U32_07645 [Candidatus Woesearchaeota archaeon]